MGDDLSVLRQQYREAMIASDEAMDHWRNVRTSSTMTLRAGRQCASRPKPASEPTKPGRLVWLRGRPIAGPATGTSA
jgi:hypothetical protein